MLNVGMTELLVFGIIALLVLGPDKLPEAARFTGKWYAKIKRMVSNVQTDIDRELRMSELREQMQQEMQRIHELENKMQLQMQSLQQQKIAVEKAPETTEKVEDSATLAHYYTPVQHQKSTSVLCRFSKAKHTKEAFSPNVLKTTQALSELKVAV